jgi:2-amino-4-hydroxy-6-hydroxymethyldihydropteridine diphosphokinase
MPASREHTEAPLAVIGLGSNVGDRLHTIESAIGAIESLPGTEVVGRSSVWRTAPVGGPPQADYYNAAVGVRSTMSMHELMGALLAIEQQHGRTRGRPNEPRTLDLDILWSEGERVAPEGADPLALHVPHPRLRERAFALIPLLEVVRDAVDPETGRLYAEILAELGTEGVAPLDSTDR